MSHSPLIGNQFQRDEGAHRLRHEIENVFEPVVIPEFEFLEIEREPFRRDAMMLDKAFLGPAPESLETVDVYLAVGEPFPMIDSKVTIAAEHERIVCLIAVGVYDASSADGFNGKAEKGFRTHIGYGFDPDDSLPFKDTEHRDLAGGAPSTLGLSSAAEVALIKFDLAVEEGFGIGRGAQDRITEYHHGPVNGIIRHGELRGNLARRHLKFEQFEDANPVLAAQSRAAQPSSGELGEGVMTPRTTTSTTFQLPQFSTGAPGTNTVSVFFGIFSTGIGTPFLRS